MLLSAVPVLVVAQSIFEIPEGLVNNPVYIYIYIYTHTTLQTKNFRGALVLHI